MKKILLLFVSSALACILGCARAGPTPSGPPLPTPTEIVYPATWTPVRTATRIPPTPTRTPDAVTLEVVKSFARTRGLTVYHAQMDMNITDPSGSLPNSIPGQPFALLNMEGRTNPDAQQFVMKGYILSMLGGDPERGIEFITVGEKVYVHGPFPYLGANQARWYVSPRPQNTGITDTANPKNILSDFATMGLPTMRAGEAQTLDGKKCRMFRGDELEAIDYFVNLDPKGNLKSSLGRINGQLEKGFFNVTVCDDGYIHHLDMGLTFRANTKAAQTGSIDFNLRLNDMNIIVPIQEPQEAIPLPKPLTLPSQNDSNLSPRVVPTPYRFPTMVIPTVAVPTFPPL